MPALRLMLQAYGFKIERFSDWGALLRDNPEAEGVADYATGQRVTVRCVPTRSATWCSRRIAVVAAAGLARRRSQPTGEPISA